MALEITTESKIILSYNYERIFLNIYLHSKNIKLTCVIPY